MALFSVTLILILTLTESFAANRPHSQRSLSGVSAGLPITRRARSDLSKRQGLQSGAIGLGDARDKDYSVQVVIGNTAVTLILDTGSSDLWAIDSVCKVTSKCGNSSAPQIPRDSFEFLAFGFVYNYGDPTHRTHASGNVASGTVSIAGLQLNNQSFGSVDDTNALSDDGSSGIFGLGFPNPVSTLYFLSSFSSAGSHIFERLLFDRLESAPISSFGPTNVTDAFTSMLPSQGPFLSRLVANGQLKQPMFTVTLQREDIEIGGNVGQLTIGQLPDGVREDALTWVEVRLYTEDQGSLSGPTSNPKELYPVWWEIPIDDVVLNGQTLPKPDLKGIGYTALIDSRTSFLAGPKDVVSSIYNSTTISGPSGSSDPPLISCTRPVDLTFVIGGENFPVDPRDFLSQQTDTSECNAGSVRPKDPPSNKTGPMSWILGIPFIKSNLVAFYYGNLTHPSVDPPRIGFLSTVPSNAADLLAADVKSADNAGGFVASSVSAPTTMFAPTSTNSLGVGQAPTAAATTAVGGPGQKSGASPTHIPLAVIAVVTSLCGFLP